MQTLLCGLRDDVRTACPYWPRPVSAMVTKTYSMMSARRATTDIKDAADEGNITRASS